MSVMEGVFRQLGISPEEMQKQAAGLGQSMANIDAGMRKIAEYIGHDVQAKRELSAKIDEVLRQQSVILSKFAEIERAGEQIEGAARSLETASQY